MENVQKLPMVNNPWERIHSVVARFLCLNLGMWLVLIPVL